MTKKTSARRLLIEPLEPRLLFSASADVALFTDHQADSALLLDAAQNTDLAAVFGLADPDSDLGLSPIETESSDTDVGLGDPAQSSAPQQLIVIDTRVDNYQTLLKDLQSNYSGEQFAYLLLDTHRDGVAQISDYLATGGQFSAVHILSHGVAGAVQLGSLVLDQSSLATVSASLGTWQNSLTETADILFYGCDLAANDCCKVSVKLPVPMLRRVQI